jgi:hypothetical protein
MLLLPCLVWRHCSCLDASLSAASDFAADFERRWCSQRLPAKCSHKTQRGSCDALCKQTGAVHVKTASNISQRPASASRIVSPHAGRTCGYHAQLYAPGALIMTAQSVLPNPRSPAPLL